MKNAHRTFFLYFLFSYLAVITINLAAFALVYQRSYRNARTQAVEYLEMQLERGIDLFDARLDEIESSVLRIGADPLISEFSRIETPLEDKNYYTILRLSGEFERFNLKTSFVDSVYLIMRRSGIVLSNYYASPSFESVYSNFLRYGDLPYTDWVREIDLWSDKTGFYPLTPIHMYRKTLSGLTFRIPISFGTTEPRAVMLALIPETSIREYFEGLLDIGASFSITTPAGKPLYSSHEARVSKRHAIGIEVGGRSGRLRYSADVPSQYLRDRVQLIRQVFIVIISLSTFMGLLLAVTFALRNSRPVARLFELMVKAGTADPATHTSGYSALEEPIQQLVGENIDIKKIVEKRNHLLRNGFYERLLRGGFSDADEAREYVESLDLRFDASGWIVAVFNPIEQAGSSPDNVADYIVAKSIIRHMDPGWHLHKTGEGEVVILPADPDGVERITTLVPAIERETGIRVLAALGGARSVMLDLEDSFSEAVMAMKASMRPPEGSAIIRYIPPNEINIGTPLSDRDEQRLSAAVITGDTYTVSGFIGELRSNVTAEGSWATETVISTFETLSGAALRILAKKGGVPVGTAGNPARYLNAYVSADDFFERLSAVLLPLCEAEDGTARSRTGVIGRRLEEYVLTHYSDPQICLESLAGAFGLNPQYISRLFKAEVGEQFSKYLEALRLNQAETRLSETSTGLEEIAFSVGYQSMNSFYKAFRRYHGMSPAQFRRNISVPV